MRSPKTPDHAEHASKRKTLLSWQVTDGGFAYCRSCGLTSTSMRSHGKPQSGSGVCVATATNLFVIDAPSEREWRVGLVLGIRAARRPVVAAIEAGEVVATAAQARHALLVVALMHEHLLVRLQQLLPASTRARSRTFVSSRGMTQAHKAFHSCKTSGGQELCVVWCALTHVK